jgi:DNA gyrase subunit B
VSDTIPTQLSESSYDASDIQLLEGLDAVRKRPGMYIGSTGERGLHHLITEVVDNSVDEALAGYCSTIEVTLQADGGVRVVDDGRGIPVDEHPVEKIPAVTLVLTSLHAGGKFGGGGYKVSGGLHGVGVSVVNALSKKLYVDILRDGHRWTQSFTYGVPDGPLEQHEETDETGTTTTYYASEDIFETVEYRFETLAARLREMAFLNKGLEIVVRDEREGAAEISEAMADATAAQDGDVVGDSDVASSTSGVERRFLYEGGLIDYVNHLNATRTPLHRDVIAFESENTASGLSLEIAMQWNDGFTESVHTFANTINTHEGGTHEEGFRAALTNTVNRFADTQGLIKKKEDRLTGDDIREGLTAIISIKLAEPQFEGQTKTKLGNTEARSYVQTVLNDRLGAWFEQNPLEGKTIVRKSIDAAVARQAARKARDLARNRKGLLGGGGLPGKLADCQSRNPEECDLHRRGQLRRRLCQGWARPADPGDPAAAGQDPQRREGAHRPDPAERRGPGDHLRARHRGARRLRHRQAALPQGRADGRRRRRRPTHLDLAAHAALPFHAPSHRRWTRLPRPAAAVQDQVDQRPARARVLRP